MPSYYWWYQHEGAHRFKCLISPEKIKKYKPEQYEYIKKVLGDLPDNEWHCHTPCCGSWYIPWALGGSQIVEIKVGDEYFAILAEFMPMKLDDEIRKVFYEWHVACGRTTGMQILQALWNCVPQENLIMEQCCKVPGIGRFNLPKWKELGEPTLTRSCWIALCKCIAQNLPTDLGHIITLCNDLS